MKLNLKRAFRLAIRQKPALLTGSASTCVVIPDATRPIPFQEVLPPVLDHLCEEGAPTQILVGLGLHRPMSNAELAPIHQVAAPRDIDVHQHDPHGDDLLDLGQVDHVPIALNRRLLEAGRVLCIGTVEPHQYAGFSGGAKAMAIGCAGESTISAMHGLTFLRAPNTKLGQLEDNPFQAHLWKIIDAIANPLGLQLVPAVGGGIAALSLGRLRQAFDEACRRAYDRSFLEISRYFDWLHLPVRGPKAINFYQASRAATYAALIDRPAIRPGAPIIVDAPCPEGIGQGAGEQACAVALQRGRQALLDDLHSQTTQPLHGGEQRAYVIARTLQRNPIALVGADQPIDALKAVGIPQYENADQALDAFDVTGTHGRRFPDIFHSIPRLTF